MTEDQSRARRRARPRRPASSLQRAREHGQLRVYDEDLDRSSPYSFDLMINATADADGRNRLERAGDPLATADWLP